MINKALSPVLPFTRSSSASLTMRLLENVESLLIPPDTAHQKLLEIMTLAT